MKLKQILCVILLVCMLIPMTVINIGANETPVLTVNNYTVTITCADAIRDMRYALGEYNTVADIKAAEGNVALSEKVVANNTKDGVFTYTMPAAGYYTVWVRMKDGTNYFLPMDMTEIKASVSSYGVMVTLHNLHDVRDFFIAKGEYNNYDEIKDNGYIVRVTSAKIGDKHDYTYTVPSPGLHTVLVRYNDGTELAFHEEVTVDEPVVTENGLQLIVSNIPDVKVIRTAYGEYSTPSEIKRAETARSFSAKSDIKGASEYKIQYREEGLVSVVVQYNNGYTKAFQCNVVHREPSVTQTEGTVSFSELDGLYIIRYAKGEYSTSTEIKNAEGSQYIRPAAAVDGVITVELEPGTYTFCVQYNDDSYNYYVITVDEPVCEHNWSEWFITVQPTYKTEGEETSECTLCHETQTRVVPVLICTHEWSEWTVVVEPEIGVAGEEERSCTLCGETETREIPALEEIVVPEATATGVKVSSAFTDEMVLQRDEALSVWGNADALSGTVVVELNGKYAWAEVDEYGSWKATFADTFSYSTEKTAITVMGAEESRIINNVLIGDVYFMIGQSNVFYSMNMLVNELTMRGEAFNIDYDDQKNMRFFRVSAMDYNKMTGVFAQGSETLYTDIYTGRPWQKPSDIGFEVTNDEDNTYSALGYLFAYEMVNRSDVPVGIIEIDAAGTALTGFAPNHLAEKWGHEQYDYQKGTYYYRLKDIEDEASISRFMYNQAIYPLSGFSTAGLIWYQGESDWYNVRERHSGTERENYYVPQYVELMNYYRSTFGNSDFPIYIMELPPCYPGTANAYIDYGEIRAEMGNIPNYLSDCYFVSSADTWFDHSWENNIHPPIKHHQASRLTALIAAQKGISDDDIEDVHGPVIKTVEYTATGATLTFDHAGQGIGVAHPDILGREVRGLEARVMFNGYPKWITVSNAQFVDANTITLDIGQEIYGVRYHAVTDANSPYDANLCNSYGMPAIAFSDYCDKPIAEPDPNAVIPTATSVRVSNVFSDNMILQRDQPLSVWGFGDAGGTVVVNLGGRNACAQVGRDGTWKATFEEGFAYNYFKQPLTIRSGGADIVIKDVLIGDVYFLIGQSNVYYSLAEQKIDLTQRNMSYMMDYLDYNDARSIRFFRVSATDFSNGAGAAAKGTKVKFNDVYNGQKWMMPSEIGAQVAEYTKEIPQNQNYNRNGISAKVYSALGYQFAFNICTKSVIPVGVIQIDASGCPLISFAPNELANKWGHETTDSEGRYYYKLTDGIEMPNAKSRFVYNQMIYPLQKFATAGIIWYQGESDQYNTRATFGAQYANGFADQFAELIEYYRATFANSDFPVFMMELPSCFYNNGSNAYMDFGAVRAEMGTISQKLSNFYMISSSDLWYETTWWNNLHPYIKYAQASRLSEAVYQYHTMYTNLELVLGPQLNHVDYVSDSKAILYFDHVGFGLTTAYGGNGYVKGIEVLINVNGQLVWHPHEGNIITGHNTIVVDTGSFELYGVRYNANTEARFPQHLTLCNSYNMPAIAFVDYRK